MKILKKALAIVISAAIVLSVMIVTASASTLAENARHIDSGVNYNFNVKGYENWTSTDYNAILSVDATDSGTLSFYLECNSKSVRFYLYDENGNTLSTSNIYTETGTAREYTFPNNSVYAERSSAFEKYVGTLSYNVTPGTYYLKVEGYWKNYAPDSIQLSVMADVPEKEIVAEIEYFTITLNVGDKIKLGAIVNMAGSDVEWTTSKKSVASVTSKGTVKAKKAGSAIIKAMYGSNSYVKVKIIVEE